ncbi:MAG TPA: Hsp20/alpha crystallin family protein [Nitrospiria bacterium]|nr:Hsp20/alpha crystallin family protein [Nitrospiria bacterium]
MLGTKEKEKSKKEVTHFRPFSQLHHMEREFDRVFGDVMGRPWFGLRWPDFLRLRKEIEPQVPAIEIYEEKDEVVVKAELPGMAREDLDVKVSEGTLTIRGERKEEEETREKGGYYSERYYGAISRSIDIPRDLETDKTTATFKNGVLELRIPKTEESKKVQKIKID